MSRIDEKFKELKKNKKGAFVCFLTCGYPNIRDTLRLAKVMDEAGVDIIELGMPFSDPLADGPVIQHSSQEALAKGVKLKDLFSVSKEIRKSSQIPLIVMGYLTPILKMGFKAFFKRCKEVGLDGVIVPDLPPEEAKEYIRQARAYNIDTIFFISPTTPLERVGFISRVSRGFIYYVSVKGVTGPRSVIPEDLKKNLARVKKKVKKPICVGFGISTPEQAQEIHKVADGVIVGSELIRKIDSLFRKGKRKAFIRFLKKFHG